MNIMGVDPGANGAIVTIEGDELMVYDMPVYEITKGKTVRKRIDSRALIDLIEKDKPDRAYVEQVSAQPSNGAASAFSFGWACAAVEVALIACKVPFTYVTPQAWKKAMNCPKDKDGARMVASRLLPHHAHNWDRKKDDGRAEAALIALYGTFQV